MHDNLVARRRPIGISVLSILLLFVGVALATFLVYGAFFKDWEGRTVGLYQTLSEIGLPLELLIAGIVFLAVLGIESGIEMWRGSAWGWYLGSFWFAYAVTRNAVALWGVYQLSQVVPAEELAQLSPGLTVYYLRYGVRLAVSLLIYNYFFQPTVRAYFGLADACEWSAVGIEFALCAGIVSASSSVASLLN